MNLKKQIGKSEDMNIYLAFYSTYYVCQLYTIRFSLLLWWLCFRSRGWDFWVYWRNWRWVCYVHKPRGFFLTPTLFHSLYLGRFKIMFNVINCGSSKNLLTTSGVTFQWKLSKAKHIDSDNVFFLVTVFMKWKHFKLQDISQSLPDELIW